MVSAVILEYSLNGYYIPCKYGTCRCLIETECLRYDVFLSSVINGTITCYDDIEECREIGHLVCVPPLEEFGRQHCQAFCEFPDCFPVAVTTTTEAPEPIDNTTSGLFFIIL